MVAQRTGTKMLACFSLACQAPRSAFACSMPSMLHNAHVGARSEREAAGGQLEGVVTMACK